MGRKVGEPTVPSLPEDYEIEEEEPGDSDIAETLAQKLELPVGEHGKSWL